ncbi:hypothetical protein HMI54_013204 [Coelomomyces lativittatus]|nr:hypothetical protein HMI54_013204 [Coelomomyces lativittatus]
MAYEYQWDSAFAGHGAPLVYAGKEPATRSKLSVSEAVISFTSIIPRDKLIVGLPAYAMGLNVQPQADTSTCLGAPVISPGGTVGYRKLHELMSSQFSKPTIDVSSVAAWTCNKTLFYSFDTPETAHAKMNYTRIFGLAGAMIWDLSTDFPTTNSLSILKGLTSYFSPKILKRRKNICIPNSNFCNVACSPNENPFEEEDASGSFTSKYKLDSDFSSPTPSSSGSTPTTLSSQSTPTRPPFTLVSSSQSLYVFNFFLLLFMPFFFQFF